MSKIRVLALDYGKKRIGLAGGDLETKIAFPKGLIENKNADFVLAEIRSLCEKWEIGLLVVGLPLNMDEDQQENAMLKEVELFVERLKKNLDLEVRLFDERLSSFEADETMRKAGQSTRLKKLHRDEYSAQVILQRFFDTINE